ncbi:hypothetical protein OU994_17320 [Pseudoduganella sp. SL102]|uniref:hypothetical protein n=1 Tax=Pseudoduganella sp. SL102 TaxID=2995154 RepID=UPI00248AFF9E|nr:hypothetical protein [Pseudoduganella sp. SL102]WBS00084.1 hypothetical protein OU994_17320 [Pseudoduganella sp. SL102]
MQEKNFHVVNIVVKNLVVVNRKVDGGDKPASAGKLKSVLVSVVCAYLPVFVSEVHKWMSNFNIS